MGTMGSEEEAGNWTWIWTSIWHGGLEWTGGRVMITGDKEEGERERSVPG